MSLLMKRISLVWLLLLSPIAPAKDFLAQFPVRRQTEHFDFRCKRDFQSIAETARFADGFVRLLKRDFFKAEFDYPIRVLVLEDRDKFKEFLSREFHIQDPPNFGIYLPDNKLFATYEGSGLGTFAHEILHPLVERNLRSRPLWAVEGIPTFFEKFYGYWKGDDLVICWGFQNPWRIAQLGTNLTNLDLKEIISDPERSVHFSVVERNESNLRMASTFLWEQGRFRRFLRLIQTNDKAGYGSHFEAAMGMPLDKIVPLWRNYLRVVAERRAAILSLPQSAVFDSESAFQDFAKVHAISQDQVKQRD